MKKQLLLSFLSLGLLLSSCSSDEPAFAGGTESLTRQVPVSFQVSADKEFSSLKSVSPEDAGVKSILYIVFKASDGSLVKSKGFKAGELSVIKDTLDQGQYKIAIFAFQMDTSDYPGDLPVIDSKDVPASELSFDKSRLALLFSGFDQFSKIFDFNVNASNSNAYTVTLERITSKLEIVPLDVASIPTDVESVIFHFKDLTDQDYNFSDGAYSNWFYGDLSSQNTYYNFSVKLTRAEFLNLNSNNPASIILFPLSSPSKDIRGVSRNVEVVATFNYSGGNSKDQTIKTTYTLDRNKILRLTGNLFPTDGTIDGTITVDNEWDAEIVEDVFDK